MSSWIDQMAAQCGPLTEAAKRFVVAQGLQPDPPRGVPALTDLLRAIDRRREGDPPDSSFIEHAGAFLGVVVAEHLGGATHVSADGRHGLQLGRFGYFDPFGTLEDVMSADNRGRALVHAIAAAEAEAEGRAPMASLVSRLHAQLAARGRAVDAVRRFEDRVFLDDLADGVEVDLARLALATQGEPDAEAEGAVARLASALLQSAEPAQPLSVAERARVLPRLVGPSFLSRLPQRQGPAQLLLRTLTDTLAIAFVVQYRGRARYLRAGEAATVVGSEADTLALSLANLTARADRVRMARADTDVGQMVVLRSGDGLDASRLLCTNVRAALTRALGGPVMVGVPHRDLLLACGREETTAVTALRQKVASEAARAPHAITTELLELEADGGWAIAPSWPQPSTTPRSPSSPALKNT